EDLMPRLRIDADLSFRAISGAVAAGVTSLAPFGAGNPRPVFAARQVEIIDGPRRLKERHLKMALKQDGRIFRAIAWRAAERHDALTENKSAVDVAFSLDQNQYNGETFVELNIADFRLRHGAAAPQPAPLDPKAVVESTSGHVVQMKGTRENVAVDFEKQFTYKDGSSRLLNVKVTATDRRDGRVFTLTGKEGQITDN